MRTGLLANFSLNPGTIYSEAIPFTIDELKAMRTLGLNSFTAFPASIEYVNDADVVEYVKELDATGLSSIATTYGFDESDQLDTMETTFGALKRAFPTISTFTTAHMCGATTDWQQPFTPCYGTCPGPSCRNGTVGLPVQDPVQIKRRNIDFMTPVLDWVKPANISACEEAGLKMWMYTSLEPWSTYCNLRFDNELHEPRLLFWQVAQLRLTGFLCERASTPPRQSEERHMRLCSCPACHCAPSRTMLVLNRNGGALPTDHFACMARVTHDFLFLFRLGSQRLGGHPTTGWDKAESRPD